MASDWSSRRSSLRSSSKLSTTGEQAIAWERLKAHGFRNATATQANRAKQWHGLAVDGEGGLGVTVLGDMRHWVQIVEKGVRPLNADPMLNAVFTAFHEFLRIDGDLRAENAWTEPVIDLLRAIFEVDPRWMVTNLEYDTANRVREECLLTDLPAVKPDVGIGLRSDHIRIARNRNSAPISTEVHHYLLSRPIQPLFELSNIINSTHMYSPFVAELKGPTGSAGKARIQNLIASYLELGIVFDLMKLARMSDPASFLPPTATMRRLYGLQTLGGGGLWKLVVTEAMNIDVNQVQGDISDYPDHDETVPRILEQETTTDTEGPDRLDFASYVTSTLWTGNVCDPVDLVTLVPILSIIRDQIDERHEVIGNWLYCLRNQNAETARKSKVVLPVDDEHSLPSKHRRLGANGRMTNQHASAQSGGIDAGVIDGNRDEVYDLHNATSNVKERSQLDRPYVEEWVSKSCILDVIE